MATTGFWPVGKNLKTVLDYADNPDKTAPQACLDRDLCNTLRYAANDEKTDRQLYAGGINCSRENACAEFTAVQKHFGMKGKIVAYHGYQSFQAGEMTPDEAFEIGKETARRMWGDRHQVLVTVHLNTDNLHCHFVVNPVSFVDGQKFKNKIGDHKELRRISDEICRERGLSVPENADFYSKGKKKEYWAHKAGKKTHRDLLREDMDYCLRYADTPRAFELQLRGLGYEIDWERFSVRARDWERSVRLSSLGFDRETVRERLEENRSRDDFYLVWNDHLPYRPRRFPLLEMERELEYSLEHSHDLGTTLVDTMFYLAVSVLELAAVTAGAVLLCVDLRREEQSLQEFVKDHHFLQEHEIHTVPELTAYISHTQEKITGLEAERSGADNVRRRAHTPEETREAKELRKALSEELRPLRKQLQRAENILEKSPHIYTLLKQEHRQEKRARERVQERAR